MLKVWNRTQDEYPQEEKAISRHRDYLAQEEERPRIQRHINMIMDRSLSSSEEPHAQDFCDMLKKKSAQPGCTNEAKSKSTNTLSLAFAKRLFLITSLSTPSQGIKKLNLSIAEDLREKLNQSRAKDLRHSPWLYVIMRGSPLGQDFVRSMNYFQQKIITTKQWHVR
ncbi:hypothetical protein Bca4012_037758 [Brassica carinata]